MTDYLKIKKGRLWYDLLSLLADTERDISLCVQEIIEKSLSVKYPSLVLQCVSETVVVLNECHVHPVFVSVCGERETERETERNGEERDNEREEDEDEYEFKRDRECGTERDRERAPLSRAQRFVVYQFIIQSLSDEEKIQVTAKLVSDILSPCIDLLTQRQRERQRETDRERLESVIEDVFILLRSPLLKVKLMKFLFCIFCFYLFIFI